MKMKIEINVFRVVVCIWLLALSVAGGWILYNQYQIKRLQLASYHLSASLTTIMMTKFDIEGGPYDKEVFRIARDIMGCDTWTALANR
jgi:predicted negative regulator of RcsB-dependent stress response